MASHKKIRLLVPVPPISNNRLKASKSGFLYQTKESKEYQAKVRHQLITEKIKPFEGDVEVSLTWFRSQRRGDLTERFKDLYDALEAEKNYGYGAYLNDRQISKETKRRIDAERDEVLIEVYPDDRT